MSAIQRRVGAAILLLAAAAALAACASNAGTGGSDPDDPVGTWGDTEAAGEPSLVLASDGKLSGTDGCNQLSGAWTDDDTIAFDNVASTMMACEDVDTWLSKLSTGTVSGDTLTVYNARGKEIGTLERE